MTTKKEADVQAWLRSLSPEKRAEVLRRAKDRSQGASNAAGSAPRRDVIERAPREGRMPLSLLERRIWFLDQFDPGMPTYNMVNALRLRGRFDERAFEAALVELVSRHEALRTRYALHEGEPHRVIDPPGTIALVRESLEAAPENERAARAEARCKAEALRGFDLAKGPLFRVTLLRLGEQEHVVVFVVHHVMYDGWSTGVVGRELFALYDAFCQGKASPLPELAIQLADYAVWEHSPAHVEALERQLAYWKKTLDGAPALLELPTDRPRPRMQSTAGAKCTFSFGAELGEALQVFARRKGTTLFRIFLTAFSVLMSRLSGQKDIVVGSLVANRRNPQLHGLIGPMIDTLPLRVDLTKNPSLEELLRQIDATTLDGHENSEVPFDKLLEQLPLERDQSHSPVFQVVLNILSFPRDASRVAGLEIERVSVAVSDKAKFDLELYVNPDDPSLPASVVYRSELFERSRIEEMMAQMGLLLRALVDKPHARVEECSLVTETAKKLLPDASVRLPEPAQEVLSRTIARWAEAAPDHPAFDAAGAVWSYDDLVGRSRAIRDALLARSLQKGDRVVVAGRRSPAIVAAMLGVLDAGGVIVPVPGSLPDARKQLMARESKAVLTIVAGSPSDASDDEPGALVVDAISGLLASPSPSPAPAKASPAPVVIGDDAMYVVFTSGSTGVPKGVLGRHKGPAHYFQWMREAFGITAADRMPQLTGLAYGAMKRDLFLPLAAGATLCFPPGDAESLHGSALLEWLRQARITVIPSVVASMLDTWFAQAGDAAPVESVRLMFLTGEPVTDVLVRQCRRYFPNARIIVLYGQVETTLTKTYYEVPAEPTVGTQPIGRPIPQAQALVLGEAGVLCGLGEPGEIVIRTPFATLGYLSGESSDAAFRKNPFCDDPSDVVYHTGDLGRYRMDGQLEMFGRVDDQVKISGVRIHPAEVAAALRQDASVVAAFVNPFEDAEGRTALCAYVVLRDGAFARAEELRHHLAQLLPVAFVPAAFVLLDRLPLTASGKVDRKALPPPEAVVAEYVAPCTPLEVQVAEVIGDILEVERVGMLDNFFELGGHSLLAVQVVVRLSAGCGVAVPVRAVFESPNLKALAEWISEQQASSSAG